MKRLVLIGFTLLSLVGRSEDKPTIAIVPFTYQGGNEANQIASTNAVVSTAFVEARRHTVVERINWPKVVEEAQRQTNGVFIDGKVVDFGRQNGAQFLVFGHLISVGSSQQTGKDYQGNPYTYYTGSASVELKIVNVTTGEVHTSAVITSTSRIDQGSSDSWNQTVSAAVKFLKDRTREWIGKAFPVSFPIVEITKEKKGEAQELRLAAGRTSGVIVDNPLIPIISNNASSRFKIVESQPKQVGDKTLILEKEVGQMRVTQVEDDNFSICKITRGGKEIMEKLAQGVKLKAVTTN
jgi:hypothetical protein